MSKNQPEPSRGLLLAIAWLRSHRLLLLFAAALLFLVIGSRWWLIDSYGSDVPWMDQWDAEAQDLYKPYYNGTLTLETWFSPHNEHRIFFTRLLAIALLLANGQWDPRLQMVVNAMLYACVASGLFLLFSRQRSPGFTIFLWAFLGVLFTFPYGLTNTLLGFQSQFYFLVAFSLIYIYTLLNSPAWSWQWFAGILAGGAALLSMGSGIMAPLAVMVVLFSLLIRSPNGWREMFQKQWMTVAVASALIAVGYYLRVSPPHHIPLRAQSPGEYAQFLLACLAWPSKPMILLALITWLPFALFLVHYASRRAKDGPIERFVLGVGFWVLLQAAALAFFRGHSAEGVESRYTDILSFGLITNILCAVWLIDRQTRIGKLMIVFTIVWLTISGMGLYAVSFTDVRLAQKQQMELRRAYTAAFVATGDVHFLDDKWLPYKDPKRLGIVLQDPAIRPILPVGIRKSLPLVPGQGSPLPSFIELSYPSMQTLASGPWNWTGIYSRFAVIYPPQRFEYHIVEDERLPFLFLYFIGSGENLSIVDSKGASHKIISLSARDNRAGRHAFVSCPTEECIIYGFADRTPFILMEPKGIGLLSIGALVAVQWGYLLFSTGGTLFLVASAVLILREAKKLR